VAALRCGNQLPRVEWEAFRHPHLAWHATGETLRDMSCLRALSRDVGFGLGWDFYLRQEGFFFSLSLAILG